MAMQEERENRDEGISCLKGLRVGRCMYQYRQRKGGYVEVELWGAPAEEGKFLVPTGRMRLEGYFLGEWHGKIELKGKFCNIKGNASGIELDFKNHGVHQASIDRGFLFSPATVSAKCEGVQWAGTYPRLL